MEFCSSTGPIIRQKASPGAVTWTCEQNILFTSAVKIVRLLGPQKKTFLVLLWGENKFNEP